MLAKYYVAELAPHGVTVPAELLYKEHLPDDVAGSVEDEDGSVPPCTNHCATVVKYLATTYDSSLLQSRTKQNKTEVMRDLWKCWTQNSWILPVQIESNDLKFDYQGTCMQVMKSALQKIQEASVQRTPERSGRICCRH